MFLNQSSRFVKFTTLMFGLSFALAAQQINPCDLNSDGTVNSADAALAASMATGGAPCSANVVGAGVCNAVLVQRIVNAIDRGCVTGTAHTVTLNWTASVSAGVTGYRVYRSSVNGGPYTEITTAPITGTSFVDDVVQGGLTYYYVVTAVDASGLASPNSNQAVAAVPV